MMDKKNKTNIYYLGLIVLGVVSRLLPHPPNFTPTGAISYFAGNKLKGSVVAYIIPLAILLISDLFFGWHRTLIYVYGSFLIAVSLGRLLQGGAWHKALGLFLSSVIFYLVTNFGVWATSGMYPMNAAGLSACYIAALPFFANQLAGTLIYGGIFFTLAHFIEKKVLETEKVAA